MAPVRPAAAAAAEDVKPRPTVPDLWSVGALARELGHPIHRVSYVIMSRGIQPVMRGGQNRLFDRAGLEEIRRACAEVARY